MAKASMLQPGERRRALAEAGLTTVARNSTSSAYITPFAIALGAGPMVLGVLGATTALGRLAQFVTGRWTSRFGPRDTTIGASAVEKAALFCLAFVATIPEPASRTILLTVLLVLAATAAETYNVTSVVWFAERLPGRGYGVFFGARATWGQWVSVAGGIALAMATSFLRRHGIGVIPTVSVALGLSAAVGAVGLGVLNRVAAPHIAPEREEAARATRRIGFGTMRDVLKNERFRPFAIYSVVWGFGVAVGSPFFSAYMVKALGFGLSETAALNAVFLASGAIMLPLWARVTDRWGNRPILIGCGFWAALIPLAWALFATPSHPYLIFAFEPVSGATWAGVTLATSNALVKIAPPKERAPYASTLSALTGLALVIAPLVGGALASLGGPTAALGYKRVLLASFILRFISLGLAFRVREVGAATLEHSAAALRRARTPAFSTATVGTLLLEIPSAALRTHFSVRRRLPEFTPRLLHPWPRQTRTED